MDGSAPAQFTMQPNVGPQPCKITCPSCQASITTQVDYKSSTKTHLIALALCFFCGICCACCIPYCCMDSTKDANHSCPNCKAFIGTHRA